MANLTISLNDELLKACRDYARRHGISLNALIREFLQKTVARPERAWFDEFLRLVDKAGGNSRGWKWNREELYRV